MREAHPNGITANGVIVLVNVQHRDESQGSGLLRAWACANGLLWQSPRWDWCVIVCGPGGEVARSCPIRKRRTADRLRSLVVADLQSLKDGAATDDTCREILTKRAAEIAPPGGADVSADTRRKWF
jgi:hypothetical protein